MKRVKKIVATVGKTKDDKAIYRTLGTMFKRDDGTFCIKIDTLPIGVPEWTGWANLYDFDDEKKEPAQQEMDGGEFDQEVPF